MSISIVYYLCFIACIMMEDYDNSRLHSRLQSVRHTLDDLGTPSPEEAHMTSPVRTGQGRVFTTPPEHDSAGPLPPRYSDIGYHRSPSADLEDNPLARRLFTPHSPEVDAHRPDTNSLYMVIDQYRGHVQHLEEELEGSQESVRVLQGLIHKRDEESRAREEEFRATLARQAQITESQQVAFAQQLEAQKRDHRSQLQELIEEVRQIKISQNQEYDAVNQEPGEDNLARLRDEVVNFVPGTINTRRGAACYDSAEQPFRSLDGGNPITSKAERHVHFAEDLATSTPKRGSLEISSIHPWQNGEGNSVSRPVPAPRRSKTVKGNTSKLTVSTDSSQMSGVDASLLLASELKKFREPKIQTLKGGYSSDATLFFNTWARDIRSVVEERQLTDTEALRLVKDKTESNALKEVYYYLEMCAEPSFEGVLAHLKTAYTSGEDASSISSEFYSRTQKPKESEDSFADDLQILARKLVHFRPSAKMDIEVELKYQFANGLKDPYYGSLARSLLIQNRQVTFTEFRSELSKVFGGRSKKGKSVGVSTNVVGTSAEGPSSVPPKIGKRGSKKASRLASLEEKLDAAIAQNKQYQELLQPEALRKVISSSVASVPCPHMATAGFGGKPFLGKPRPPTLRPGDDGSLDPTQECRYCKDKGHLIDNCTKLKAKKAAQAAGLSSRDQKKEN